ncbi:hypothetical protein K438DRAFT_1820046 [Mycena galopus ATCC 62051]|nr:hypothetical protein K438DRAFT_1820046 [Mycena galopus ATCC 62051]
MLRLPQSFWPGACAVLWLEEHAGHVVAHCGQGLAAGALVHAVRRYQVLEVDSESPGYGYGIAKFVPVHRSPGRRRMG